MKIERRTLLAIALVYGFYLAGGLVAGSPLSAALLSTGAAAGPSGDAALFEPGALILLEALRIGARPLASAVSSSALIALAVALLALVPLAALIATLATRPRPVHAAVSHFSSFALLAGLTLLLRVLVMGGATLIWMAVEGWFDGALSEPTEDKLLLGWIALTAVALALVGIVQDLARAACVVHDCRALGALSIGLSALRARPGAVLLGWLTPAAWSIALFCGAAFAVGWIDVSRPGGGRAWLAFLVHQLAIFGFIALRAWWLADAVRLTRIAQTPLGELELARTA